MTQNKLKEEKNHNRNVYEKCVASCRPGVASLVPYRARNRKRRREKKMVLSRYARVLVNLVCFWGGKKCSCSARHRRVIAASNRTIRVHQKHQVFFFLVLLT